MSASVLAFIFGLTGLNAQTVEYPSPLVRERQAVTIDGVTETWELQWKASPRPACEPSDSSLTCPCTGFAYGETGESTLLRLRNGLEIDRLELASLFTEANVGPENLPILQRWEPDYDADFKASEKLDFPPVVSHRPVVKVMQLIDYDHDGNATEFYLKTDTLPCGVSDGVVIGVSRSNRKLHMFSSVSKPNQPLLLQRRVWTALGNDSDPVEMVTWECEDHGSEEETTINIQAANGIIQGTERVYACPRKPNQSPVSVNPL